MSYAVVWEETGMDCFHGTHEECMDYVSKQTDKDGYGIYKD